MGHEDCCGEVGSRGGGASGHPVASEVAWTQDAKAALAEAVKEKKDVLIDFTGSDWCGWCKKLDAEVFTQEAFVAEAPTSFVFLKLDSENKAGLKAKYEAMALMGKVRTAMQSGQADEALALADEGLKAVGDTGEAAQDLLFAKSEILYRKRDMTGAKATLEAALKAAPDSDKAAQIKGILECVFKDTP